MFHPWFYYLSMICICAAFPKKRQKGLLIDRVMQQKLQAYISQKIGYKPFLFNTEKGFYVFFEAKDRTQDLEASIAYYLDQNAASHQLIAAHTHPSFFVEELIQVLNNPDASCFAWKNFISSFLIQLDPFKGSVRAIHSLFKEFVEVVKKRGNTTQLEYLKRKMNSLRARVNVAELLQY